MQWLKLLLMTAVVMAVLAGGAPVGAQSPGDSPLPTPVGAPGGGGDVPHAEFSGTRVAAVTAFLLSLAMGYLPGFSAWWGEFPYKREGLAGAGLAVAIALVALHYAGALNLGLPAFGWPVVWQVGETWLAFAGAGQLAFTGQRAVTDHGRVGQS